MRDFLMTRWTETGDKIVQLAEDFPSDRFEFRVTPDVRSFEEQLRHVAFWNEYIGDVVAGRQPDGSGNELPAERFASRAQLLKALRKSFTDVRDALAKANGTLSDDVASQVVSFIAHNGEHYGQLVLYCRANGLVPPASR
ncbi:MAG: DinB family protein [Gemmatimonadaceae bacterium]